MKSWLSTTPSVITKLPLSSEKSVFWAPPSLPLKLRFCALRRVSAMLIPSMAPSRNWMLPSPLRVSTSCFWLCPLALPLVAFC